MLTHLKKSALLGLSALTLVAALAMLSVQSATLTAEQPPQPILLAEDDYQSGGG